MMRLFVIAAIAFAPFIGGRAQDTHTKRPRTWFGRVIKEFNNLDTAFIEPNHYNWAAMLQATTSSEWFNIRRPESTLNMSSDPIVKIGPYLGWRWIFLGYSTAVNDFGPFKSKRTEFELSVYSSMIGCDFIYRRTGDDFRWQNNTYMTQHGIPNGEYSGGVNIRTLGINLYYIFNHRRFSLPSLFSQSTVQKRSCGSWMMGASLTTHKFDFDVENWPSGIKVDERSGDIEHLHYTDYAVSFGYAHNWVLRKNLMFGISLMPAIGYKRMSQGTDIEIEDTPTLPEWITQNINFDLTARAALVWNNTKNFAGLSLVVHNYNFSKDKLTLHNTFGTISLYVGMNFIKRAASP